MGTKNKWNQLDPLPPTRLQQTGQEEPEQLQPKPPSDELKLNQPKPLPDNLTSNRADSQSARLKSPSARPKKGIKQKTPKPTRLQRYGRVGQWFQMLCFMNVPVFGFLYMLALLLYKKTPSYKRSFAAAYILYRILVLVLAVTVLFVLYRMGISFLDEILKYAGKSA